MGENLSKSYGSLEIFTAVDLAIDKGSKVVIIGLNGAGKTTLLRMLAGIDKPDTGKIIEATDSRSAISRRSTKL
jgi:ABC-type Fe3+/spermidine/putrescine transport system ATPase subunit